MKRIILGTNWKMNKTLSESVEYLNELLEVVNYDPNVQLFVVPPFTSLYKARKLLKDTPIELAAQNMHWKDSGAFTGEISPSMLEEIGVDIVIVGHSERRQYYNENDFDCNKKVLAGLKHGLKILLCIGEDRKEKKCGASKEVCVRQLKIGLHKVEPKDIENIMIAYEPIWSVGEKGTPAEPEYVFQEHANIREGLREIFGERGKEIPILYGGSVSDSNCVDFLKLKNVDGLLLGRYSWNADGFKEIIDCVSKYDL